MAQREQLKVGDVVKLKSGSPNMTVARMGNDGGLSCTWFDEKHALQTGYFRPETLEKVRS